MSIFVRLRDQGHHQGSHREDRHVPHHASHRVRHQRGGRRDPRQGRSPRSTWTVPVFDTVAEAVAETGADASRRLRAAAVRRGCHHRGGRSPAETAGHRAITEGIPVVDMMKVKASWQRAAKHAAHRPELPRRDHARASARSASCPATSTSPGRIGVISRSGTLTYEAVWQLSTEWGWGRARASASAATR